MDPDTRWLRWLFWALLIMAVVLFGGTVLYGQTIPIITPSVNGVVGVPVPPNTNMVVSVSTDGLAVCSSVGQLVVSGLVDVAQITIDFIPIPKPVTNPFDLNGDGIVNSVDVGIVANQAVHKTSCTTGDLDHNGICNFDDIVLELNHRTGL